MKLYIVRHADALDVGQQGITKDHDRPLSDEGIRRAEEAGRALRAMDVRLDRVGASPLLRASQTARILAQAAAPDAPVETCPFLAPGACARDVAGWMNRSTGQALMIVGHMPDLGHITAAFISKPAAAALVFKKGAIACLDFPKRVEPGAAELEWLMQPAQLRAVDSGGGRR
ncbi:MAG TPA: phosphohistidine phosphatase SixA [Candidatus Brocadiia bacterium]|nr:phosphohistidine phosphatase SixA [Candidatus Brocadiia bacterium]